MADKKIEMRAICVKQPWAWFIVNGYKDVENRNSEPPVARIGQPVIIVASKRRVTKADYADFLDTVKDLKIRRYPKSVDDFIYGAGIGVVTLTGAKWNARSRWADQGSCHWLLARAKILKPLPIPGQQALFFKVKI
jgi:hypothetical protein